MMLFERQQCEKCGWSGVTRAQRNAAFSRLAYLAACIVFVVLLETGKVSASIIGWPVAVVALVWFYAMPQLILRGNACGSCGVRMRLSPKK